MKYIIFFLTCPEKTPEADEGIFRSFLVSEEFHNAALELLESIEANEL